MKINNVEVFSGMDDMDTIFVLLQQKLEFGGELTEEEQDFYDKAQIVHEYKTVVELMAIHDKLIRDELLASSGMTDADFKAHMDTYYDYEDEMLELINNNPEIDFNNRLIHLKSQKTKESNYGN